MAIVRFFESNSLKFKRLEDYTSLQNDQTRLYYDQLHIEIRTENYFQKIAHGEPLWFQFRTDYDPSTITVSLVKDDGTTTSLTSSLVTTATLDTGLTQHELSFSVDSLTGNYYILITFSQALLPLATFQSEWFEVAATFDDHLLIEWIGQSETYPDGMIWDAETQKLWIYARLFTSYFGAKATVWEDSSYSLSLLKKQPLKFKKLEIDKVPDYIAEKLNIAFSHKPFYINNVEYVVEEGLQESEPIEGGLSLYHYEMKLRQVNYEDYTTDVQLTGTAPVFDDAFLLINDTDLLSINDNDELKINN